MRTYTVRDLRDRTGELIRSAESGELSVITKHGTPVFIAVPFDDLLLKEGVRFALAAHLFDEKQISLSQAAGMASRTISEMIDLLGKYNISVIHTTPGELDQELSDFS